MQRTHIAGTSCGTNSWSPPTNSLGTSKDLSLEFAAFGSGPDAKHSRATVVPSVLFFFFGSVHSYGFCALSKTFSQSRSINLLREKRSVLKLTLISQPRSVSRNGQSAYSLGTILRGRNNFVFFSSCLSRPKMQETEVLESNVYQQWKSNIWRTNFIL